MEVHAHTTLAKVAGSAVVPLVCPPLTLSCNRRALAMRRVEVGFGTVTTASKFVSRSCELFDALSVWHESGWVHGDLKPTNIGCARGVLHLFDLGLSMKLPSPDARMPVGGPVGTETYMAPEVRSKRAGYVYGACSDVYSAGRTIIALLDATLKKDSANKIGESRNAPFLLTNIRKLMAKACKNNPDKRPSARVIGNTLRYLLAKAATGALA